MKKLIVCCAFVSLSLLVNGCAGISTRPATPSQANGIRIYPQKIYLLVDEEKSFSKFISLPDIKNAYDVKPWSVLSKHDFTIKIEEAQVKELTSNQDSSAALSLLQKIVETAADVAKAAAQGATGTGKAVAQIDIPSSLGLTTGIYELSETGIFKKVNP